VQTSKSREITRVLVVVLGGSQSSGRSRRVCSSTSSREMPRQQICSDGNFTFNVFRSSCTVSLVRLFQVCCMIYDSYEPGQDVQGYESSLSFQIQNSERARLRPMRSYNHLLGKLNFNTVNLELELEPLPACPDSTC
jgi:hypothetical protein